MHDQSGHQPSDLSLTSTAMRYWPVIVFEGAAMTALGLAALVAPFIAALGIPIVMGLILISVGLFSLFSSVTNPGRPDIRWATASSTVTLIFGLLFFAWPFGGTVHLAIALAGFLAADGILSIGMAAEQHRARRGNGSLLYVSGTVSILFAVFLVWWVPVAELWMLNMIFGIDFILNGIATLIIAMETRKLAS